MKFFYTKSLTFFTLILVLSSAIFFSGCGVNLTQQNQEYKNEEFGFSISHPDYIVFEKANEMSNNLEAENRTVAQAVNKKIPNDIQPYFIIYYSTSTLKDVIHQIGSSDPIFPILSQTDISLGNTKAVRITQNSGELPQVHYLIPYKNAGVLVLSGVLDENEPFKIHEEIMKNFRYTSQ